jgi:L-ribulose-5-phosphate 3-epimerase
MKRRTFLQRTALATAAGLILPNPLSGADESAKKPPLKKAIMYSTIGVKGSVMEKFRAVKEAGFAGVEAMGGMSNQEVLEAAKETGLQIPSVCCHTHWAKPLSDANPETRKTGLKGLELSLRDAKRYGATSVLLVPAVVNKQVSYADAYKRSQEEIRKAIPVAEETGVVIAIENVWNQFLLSPLEAARYVDEFQSKWVGWHFDIGNIINFGFPEQWIRVLGKRIQKLHIKEYSRKKRDKEGPGAGFAVEFLEGDNDWPAIMKALDEVGYNGWGIAEQGGGGTPEGLKNLSDRMDRIFASQV